MTEQHIAFSDRQRPILPAGKHTITVTQDIVPPSGPHPVESFMRAQTLRVDGPRYTLNPTLVHAVHPPVGHQSDYTDTLPHIVLTDCTLPWQRFAQSTECAAQSAHTSAPPVLDDRKTWLALLVLPMEDAPPLVTSPIKARFPDARESGELTEIAVSRAVFDAALPDWHDLDTFVHVRHVGITEKPSVEGDTAAARFSVVLASQVPRIAGRHVAHLVSLEDVDLRDRSLPGTDVHLISLFHWEFTHLAGRTDTPLGTLMHLDIGPLALPVRTPDGHDTAEKAMVKWALAQGYCALNHVMRGPLNTVSWYRGPLQSSKRIDPMLNPKTAFALNSDSLLRYDPAIGMFDVSLAAAWQLGRMAAMNDAAFSATLLRWRQTVSREAQRKRLAPMAEISDVSAAKESGHDAPRESNSVGAAWHALPMDTDAALLQKALNDITQPRHIRSDHPGEAVDPTGAEDEARVFTWLDDLTTFKHVPTQYLVPDPNMLPPESLRFFQVDANWLLALVAGALRLNTDAAARDAFYESAWLARHFPTPSGLAKTDHAQVGGASSTSANVFTGFLLRSQLVATWQGLEVRGKVRDRPLGDGKDPTGKTDDASGPACQPMRLDIIGPSMLFALYRGSLESVEFVEPAETTAFFVPAEPYFRRQTAARYTGGASAPLASSIFATHHTQTSRSVRFYFDDQHATPLAK
ncbi:hypothetical protein [Robbsia sp. KACC 23696]|uniref:hypothetical protein n=1 Tax=Robbsia sp. KACC 23696 TaxID=3149231 RepID=UPI00325C1747